MGKATRRVKRIKRSKKQVHRARGRKTNHRRQMQRHTRRQRGGEKIIVCKTSGIGPWATGIAITYNTETKTYTIGNHDYKTLKTMPRYANALTALTELLQTLPTPPPMNDDEYIILNQTQFEAFRTKYCGYGIPADKGHCDLIKRFEPPVAAPAAAAAAAPVAEVPKMSPNVLTVTSDGMIAYNNNHGVMRSVTVDKSKPNYEFDNFIIPNNDQDDISGKLTVKFVPGPHVVTAFTLELNVDPTESLIECMNRSVIGTAFVTIDTIVSSKPFFGTSKMVITGTLMEQKDYTLKKSTYDFSSFVLNFVKKYQDCLVAGQFVVSDQQVYINLITKHIAECSQRIDKEKVFSPEQKMSLKAVLTAFQSRFNDLKQTKDLEALKTLHEEVNKFRNGDLFQAKQTSLKNASLAAQMKRLSVSGPGAGAAPLDFTEFGIDSDGNPI